ncbi:hypothetical protein GOBAR_AA22551 [Gossypium barbadense]|uniref:Uncharacterized protein n=1 Tax=Gossypium barbadense TaxID=3634 RepID=A0A2P5X439_GOSBA|nr:hypothetical protein GOBAR_AA22551 [Gossypium barbadense]
MGRIEEPINFFYHYYEKWLCQFALVESLRVEGGRQHFNLLVAPTDHRVVAGGGLDQSSKDTSSRTDSIFRKLNEDIDLLVTGVRKKCKTILRAVRISSVSDEERGSVELEHWSQRMSDTVDVIATVARTLIPRNFLRTSSPSIPPVTASPFDVRKVDLDILAEEDPTNANMTPSTNNEAAPVDNANQAGSFASANCVGYCGSSLVSFSMTAKSFTLANCVGGCGSSPVSLSMTIRSFTLTNCDRGCGSLPANLSLTTGSFVFANCVGGCGFFPLSLSMTIGALLLITMMEVAVLSLQDLV